MILPVVTSYTGTEKDTNDFEYALVTTTVLTLINSKA